MFCQKCGASLPDNSTTCPSCGAEATAYRTRTQQTQQNWEQPRRAPSYVNPITDESQLPEKYRPLGAWTYFALNLLFCVPIVGFIFLIIFSCSQANINRRNFARSFFCIYAIAAIILIIALAAGGTFAASLLY